MKRPKFSAVLTVLAVLGRSLRTAAAGHSARRLAPRMLGNVRPERTVEEQWMVPRGVSMMGTSRSMRGGKLVAYEMGVIREEGPVLAYEAPPSRQPVATFLSTTVCASQVVFENPSHDFPQQTLVDACS